MKNKQHKYIFKALVNCRIPSLFREYASDLICIDSIIGGHSSELLSGYRTINFPQHQMVTKEAKRRISEIINNSKGEKREELLLYYRLVILAEAMLLYYREDTEDEIGESSRIKKQ